MKITKDSNVIDRIYSLIESDDHLYCDIIDNPSKLKFEFIDNRTNKSVFDLSINDIKIIDKYFLESSNFSKTNLKFSDLFYNFTNKSGMNRDSCILGMFINIYFNEKRTKEKMEWRMTNTNGNVAAIPHIEAR